MKNKGKIKEDPFVKRAIEEGYLKKTKDGKFRITKKIMEVKN